MRNIVVVECNSTGKNYIRDIINRNYNPIVLEMKTLNDTQEAIRYCRDIEEGYRSIPNDHFEIIYEKDTYEENLEMVKKYDPLLVVPGSEKGVILATKLANDLNLKCNPIENLDAMTLKDKMHERLAENNVRSIRGQVIKSIEEAIEFYDSESLEKVVVKPIYSAGSVGVRLCDNKEEMIHAIEEVFSQKGIYGNDIGELLIQEQIEGEEYVVNTVSCNGVHRITSIWKYKKEKTSEGGNVYDYVEVVTELDIDETTLVEYVYDVCDAIGIKYGPVHGEFMIDEKGPILIEVNCRPRGDNLDADYLNLIFGHHETDCSLDSYLDPDKFESDRKKSYETFAYGILKKFIIPNDLVAKSSPIDGIDVNLKSHYRTMMHFCSESQAFSKTQDLETSGGQVCLVNKDYKQIRKDLEFLRKLERKAFELVLSEEKGRQIFADETKVNQNIKRLLDNIDVYGTAFLITEKIFEDLNIKQATLDGLDEIAGEFDCVIVNLNESINNEPVRIVSKIFLDILDKVKVGGTIYIPITTYVCMPDGRLGTEALLKLLDFKLEMPIHKFTGMIIASKKE